jgi:hypothetical protein
LIATALPAVAPNWLATLPPLPATLLCLALALSVPFLVGVPLVWLARGRRALGGDDWLIAPFVGLGALVLVLQNLVYLDVPVARSARWVWVAIGLVALAFAVSGRLRDSLRTLPRAALVLALAAYALQGWALLQVGARHWVGRLWEDQFSYTTMAQFFQDEPFSLDVADTGQRAYLFRVLRPSLGKFYIPVGLKENRIGQSVLQAFYSASAGGDAKALFGPTIVLCGPLVALAAWLLGARLGLGRRALFAAAWLAAILPALTLLQLESFLSHALVIGFFLVWLVALDDLGRSPGVGTFALAALVLSFVVATYGEMWLAMLALAAVSLGATARRARRPVLGLLLFALLAAAPYLLNPRFVGMLLFTSAIGSLPAMHTAIYPWAYSLEGLARLWLGDLAVSGPAWWLAHARGVGLLAALGGLAGLVALVLRRPARAGGSSDEPPTLALRLSLLCLALGPLPLLLSGHHPYQYYKVVQSAAPALVVGLVALLCGVTWTRARARYAGPALVLVLALAATLASLRMVQASAGPILAPRSNAALLLAPEVREVQARLETLRGERIVFGRGLLPALNAWLAWSARFNELWLGEPFLSRDRLERSPDATRLLDLPAAPFGALLLTRRDDHTFARPPAARTLWSNAAYELWRPAAGAWVRLFDVDRPGHNEARLALDRPHAGETFALGHGTLRLRLLAGATGRARIALALTPRADAAGVRIAAPGCAWDAEPAAGGQADVGPPLAARGSTLTLSCDVKPGFTDVRLQAKAESAGDPTHVADAAPAALELAPQ